MSEIITIRGDRQHFRALVRRALREGIAVTMHEERAIEDAFLEFAVSDKKGTRNRRSGGKVAVRAQAS